MESGENLDDARGRDDEADGDVGCSTWNMGGDLFVEGDGGGGDGRGNARKEAVIEAAAPPEAVAGGIEGDSGHEDEIECRGRKFRQVNPGGHKPGSGACGVGDQVARGIVDEDGMESLGCPANAREADAAAAGEEAGEEGSEVGLAEGGRGPVQEGGLRGLELGEGDQTVDRGVGTRGEVVRGNGGEASGDERAEVGLGLSEVEVHAGNGGGVG